MTTHGQNPVDWELVTLGQLLKSAQSGFASGARDPNGVIQMRMNNVTLDGNLNWTSFIRVPTSQRQLAKYDLHPGDVLFNATNSPELVGKTAAFEGYSEPVVFSNHFVRLRTQAKGLDPRYLARWLTHQQQRKVFENLCTRWVNQASVRKDDLLALRIPLPPLPEQKRIAAILAKADRLRRLRRYALTLSEAYLQSVFLEMFGDPATNPMGWSIRNVKDLCRRITDGVHKTPNYLDSGVPFISTIHVSENGIDWEKAKFISQAEHENLIKRCHPQPGDILYTKVGSVGMAVPVIENQPFSIFVQLALLKVNEESCNFLYLTQLLNMPSLRARVLSRLTGATMKYIGIGEIGRIRAICPPLDLQRSFALIVQKFERLRAQQREAQRQAEHLFQTLLHRAFRGEV